MRRVCPEAVKLAPSPHPDILPEVPDVPPAPFPPQLPAPQPFPDIVVSMPVLIWYVATIAPPPFPLSDALQKTKVGFKPSVVVIEAMVETVLASN